MDYNEVIISLGGVERILVAGPLTLTDAELEAHIVNNVVGTKHSVSAVKAQVPVLQAQYEASKAQVNEVTKEELLAKLQELQTQIAQLGK